MEMKKYIVILESDTKTHDCHWWHEHNL